MAADELTPRKVPDARYGGPGRNQVGQDRSRQVHAERLGGLDGVGEPVRERQVFSVGGIQTT